MSEILSQTPCAFNCGGLNSTMYFFFFFCFFWFLCQRIESFEVCSGGNSQKKRRRRAREGEKDSENHKKSKEIRLFTLPKNRHILCKKACS